jgi:hypothetical protein
MSRSILPGHDDPQLGKDKMKTARWTLERFQQK